jgi:glycosyltransferase involved in cell wall biosynthesis
MAILKTAAATRGPRIRQPIAVRRVLILTSDHVGGTMSVPGIRASSFARELARDFDVTLAARSFADGEPAGVELVQAADDERQLERLVQGFDVVVAQRLPFATMRALARSDTKVVYDLYVPFAVEHLSMFSAEPRTRAEQLLSEWAAAGQSYALASGDAFVCATERQRDLWLGVLARKGRIDRRAFESDATLRTLIDVVPLGIPGEAPPPRRPARGERVLLWAGGIWNWLDPLTPIRAVARLGLPALKLVFLGVDHPRVERPAMVERAQALARELNAPVEFRSGWVPYEDRARHLGSATLGVSAHFDSLETRYAFRTRLLDHLWAGLPTVTTRGDVLSKLVQARGLGRAVAPGDVDGYARAIEELLDDPPPGARFEPVREELAWPRVVEPLRRLAAEPGRRVRAPRTLQDAVLRARISLALGGPGAAVRRQLRKLAG